MDPRLAVAKPRPPAKTSLVRRVARVVLATWALAIAAGALVLYVRPRADPEAMRRDAYRSALAGRWAEVEAVMARLPSPSPTDWILRAQAALALGREDAAASHLGHVSGDGPWAAQSAFLLAKVEQHRHRARLMESALREALRRDPHFTPARNLLVYLYGTQERRAELIEQFSALAEEGPVTFDLALHWCLSHGEIGDPAKVRPDLERFVAADPDDRRSRIALAEARRRSDDLDAAEALLAALPATDLDARVVRARIALDRGDQGGAGALLSDASTPDARLDRLRGRLALARRDGPAAVRYFRLSDAAEPNNYDTLHEMAQALRLAGDEAEAARVEKVVAAHRALIALVHRANETPGAGPDVLCELAAACEAVGHRPEARAWYRLAVSADPGHLPAQQGLARLGPSRAKPL